MSLSDHERAAVEAGATAGYIDLLRTHMHDLADQLMTDPMVSATVDQNAAALRGRLEELGVDLTDEQTRLALLAITETVCASIAPYALTCRTGRRLAALSIVLAAAVVAIDTHERGARPC